MGAAGFAHAGRALLRPHDRDLRPARVRAQHSGPIRRPQSTPDEHADDLHRIIAGARRRTGGPVRQQRRSHQRAGAGRQASGATSGRSSPTSRRSRRSCRIAEDALAAARAIHETYMRSGLGAGMAQFIARRQSQGAVPGRLRRAAAAGSGDVRDADRGRRLADRPDARAERSSPARTTSPTSMRFARHRRGSSWPSASSPRARWPHAAARLAVAERLGTEPVDLPERPRRVHGWRVRPDRRARGLRRQAARGPRLGG